MQQAELTPAFIGQVIAESVETKRWICSEIYKTRAKDYRSAFRQMVYENEAELDAVVGRLDENAFIRQQQEEFEQYSGSIKNRV